MSLKSMIIKTFANDPHYADKGSHGERHKVTQQKRKEEQYKRRMIKAGWPAENYDFPELG